MQIVRTLVRPSGTFSRKREKDLFYDFFLRAINIIMLKTVATTKPNALAHIGTTYPPITISTMYAKRNKCTSATTPKTIPAIIKAVFLFSIRKSF